MICYLHAHVERRHSEDTIIVFINIFELVLIFYIFLYLIWVILLWIVVIFISFFKFLFYSLVFFLFL